MEQYSHQYTSIVSVIDTVRHLLVLMMQAILVFNFKQDWHLKVK